MYETIRSDGHFYLVEEYLPNHVSLDALCAMYADSRLPVELCQIICDQLVSVVRDGLHKHSVCHRDISRSLPLPLLALCPSSAPS